MYGIYWRCIKSRPAEYQNWKSLGEEISNADELKELLVKQIENRVRWRESVNNMINSGVSKFIEMGPGKVLSGLVKRIDKNVKITSINNQSDVESLKL